MEKRSLKDNSYGILGAKIRKLRKSKGLTQEQLAEKVNIDDKYLARIEKGMHNPTFNVMKKLSKVLDFDMAAIDETSVDDIQTPNKIYLRALQILNSAKDDREMILFLESLQHTQKCLKQISASSSTLQQ